MFAGRVSEVPVVVRLFLALLLSAEHAGDDIADFLRSKRLLQEVDGAELHGLDSRLNRPVGGQQNDGRSGRKLAEPPQDLHAVHAGHLDVHEDQVVKLLSSRLESFRPVVGQVGFVTQLLQRFQGHFLVDRIVFRQEDLCPPPGPFRQRMPGDDTL